MFKAHALENHPKSTVLLSETDTENVDKPTKKESEILKEVDGKKLLLYFAMNFVVALKSLEAGQNLKLKCHFMLFFVISCHFMSFHVILCHFMSFHVIAFCHEMPFSPYRCFSQNFITNLFLRAH